MPKAIVQFGYDRYVMDAQDALTIHEILGRSENYHREYRRDSEGGTLYYVWPQDEGNELKSIDLIPDNLYRMAKLAGKPDKK